jgi:hypothetical protein
VATYLLDTSVIIDALNSNFVAVFTAYFDASGSESSTVMSVAGFVSRLEKWARFESAWKSFLPDTVSMFHMTDFVTGREGWESWKGPEHRKLRAKLLENLVGCIKLNTNQGFASSVRMSDYREVNRQFKLREYVGSPYVFLGMSELGRLKMWAARAKIDHSKILCLFEDGDHGQGDLIKRARSEGFNAVPKSKKHLRAFDACDLTAWRARVQIDDAWERQVHLNDPEGPANIMRSISHLEAVVRNKEVGMFSAGALHKICESLDIPKRSVLDPNSK